MSIFDFPRLNFTGTITLNPGTANNDDYAANTYGPDGQPVFGLIDSATVQPKTYGMTDEAFIEWVQGVHPFAQNNRKVGALIPAEWNYYGSMSANAQTQIVGVQTSLQTVATKSADNPLIGTAFNFAGNITDVNSEGSPPGTQLFLNTQQVVVGNATVGGQATKACCAWIYFTRNLTLQGDEGAGGYFYHVIRDPGYYPPGFKEAGAVGLIVRYYIFAKHGAANSNEAIVEIYNKKGINAADFQITGTVAPLLNTDSIDTAPVGRLLRQNSPNIPTEGLVSNNTTDGLLALAPAVVHTSGGCVSVDFLGTFPEKCNTSSAVSWKDSVAKNPKWVFGAVTLMVTLNGTSLPVAPVAYSDTAAGNARGWVFDFDLTAAPKAQEMLNAGGSFSLHHDIHGDVLTEAPYYIFSNEQAFYAEQCSGDQPTSTTQFRNQGKALTTASVAVYKAGVLQTDATLTVWRYSSTPLGTPGLRTCLTKTQKAGDPIAVPVEKSGNFMLVFDVNDSSVPAETLPSDYTDYIAPPFMILCNRSEMSIRVLPNEDLSQYWSGAAGQEVANDSLTFDILYQKVLRNYYLLFPTMRRFFDLNDEKAVAANASGIMALTDLNAWHTPGFMPITRDMSESRRTLLRAWCRKNGTA